MIYLIINKSINYTLIIRVRTVTKIQIIKIILVICVFCSLKMPISHWIFCFKNLYIFCFKAFIYRTSILFNTIVLLDWCMNIYLDHIVYSVSSVILIYGASIITYLCRSYFTCFFCCSILFYSKFLYVCILLECCTYCIYWTLWSVTSSYCKWELMFYCFTVPTWNKITQSCHN